MYYLTQKISSQIQIFLFILIFIANIYFLIYWSYWIVQALLDITAKYFPYLRYRLKKEMLMILNSFKKDSPGLEYILRSVKE